MWWPGFQLCGEGLWFFTGLLRGEPQAQRLEVQEICAPYFLSLSRGNILILISEVLCDPYASVYMSDVSFSSLFLHFL